MSADITKPETWYGLFCDEFDRCYSEINPGNYRTGCGKKLKDLDDDSYSMPAFGKEK